MKHKRLTILAILGLAALVAAPASAAQEQKPAGAKTVDAKAKGAKDVPAKQAGETPAQEPGQDPAAGGQKAGKGGRYAGKGEQARAHKEILKPVALEEARYRKRIAQLDRVEELATAKGHTEQLGQIEELRVRNDEYHTERMAELRATHGDENVDAALAFIEKNGKGKAVQMPRSKAGRQKAKEQTGKGADQRAGDAKEQRDRLKDKAKGKEEQKP